MKDIINDIEVTMNNNLLVLNDNIEEIYSKLVYNGFFDFLV